MLKNPNSDLGDIHRVINFMAQDKPFIIVVSKFKTTAKVKADALTLYKDSAKTVKPIQFKGKHTFFMAKWSLKITEKEKNISKRDIKLPKEDVKLPLKEVKFATEDLKTSKIDAKNTQKE